MKNINEKKLEKWKKSKSTKKLIYALKIGGFKTRLNASKHLIELNDPIAKQSLINALNDSVPVIIDNVKLALQKLTLLENEQQLLDQIINSKDKKEKEKLITELSILSKLSDGEKLKLKSKKEPTKNNVKKKKEIRNTSKKIIIISILFALILSLLSFTYFYEFKVNDGTSSTCVICSGTGKKGDICPTCNGKGKIVTVISCDNCNGTGTRNCNYSFGLKTTYFLVAKRESIYKCRNGRMYTNGIDKIYNGDLCKECNGTGKIKCNTCNGSGKIKKIRKCKKCDKGIVNIRDCNNCNKTGSVPNYEKFTIINKYVLPLFGIKEKVIVKEKIVGKYPQASRRLLNSNDLKDISKSELRIMRNEIFARHGHIYNSGAMAKYFKKQNWYKATIKDASQKLTKIEKKNIQLILKYEK